MVSFYVLFLISYLITYVEIGHVKHCDNVVYLRGSGKIFLKVSMKCVCNLRFFGVEVKIPSKFWNSFSLPATMSQPIESELKRWGLTGTRELLERDFFTYRPY
jgi:hypothetical protein